MAAGDIHVADLLDTEMDSMVRSRHLNKPVWLTSNRRTIRPGEGACRGQSTR